MRRIFAALILVFLLPAALRLEETTLAEDAPLVKPRYISLAPAATEILFALGLADKVVGNTTFCNYPQEARRIAKVGTFSEPNIEKILALKPDIIFATGLEQAPWVERLERLGLKLIVSDPKNINELFESILEFGKATKKEREAKLLVAIMRERIAAIKSKAEKIPREQKARVYIEIWHDPIMTAGPGSIVDELLTLAGANNIAYDAPRAYSRFSAEAVIERDPDFIILGYMAKDNAQDAVINRLGWENIKAIKNRHIISDINPDLIFRAGPRIAEGIEEIYRHIYNE